MPRNDLKAYETLTARIPQALVDAARHYASQHHCTVSDMIRDSLQMYLDAEGTNRLSIREQEVRRGHISLAQALAAFPVKGQTEVIQDDSKSAVTQTEVIQGQTTGAILEGQTEVIQGQTEVLPHENVPPFDPARFQLGRLCVGGHAYHGTPQTLYRLPKMVCPQCDAARARAQRAAQRQAAAL